MSFMETNSGKKFEFNNIKEDAIVIEDIAEQISKLCRFNGACRGFYSVAEHSVILSKCVPVEYQLHALLHDATEAYVGDVISPVKREFTSIKEYENKLLPIIFNALGVKYDHMLMDMVHYADIKLLVTEKRQIMPNRYSYGDMEDHESYKIKVQGLNWQNAKQEFLDRWEQLK